MNEAGEIIQDDKIHNKITKMKKDGHISKAIEMCQNALKNDPTNAELHIRLGDLYLEKHLDIYQPKQFLDEAILEYQLALETNLNSPALYYKLGCAYYYKGELEKALNHFTMSLEYDPKNSDAFYMVAKIFAKKDRISESIEYVEKALKFGGVRNSRAHYLMFRLLKCREVKSFKHALDIYTNLFLSALKLPFDSEASKELAEKISYLKFFPVFLQGYYLEKTRGIYQAIDLYQEAIEKAPGFLMLYLQLGNAYRQIGRTEDAINEYKMAIWLDPTNITAHKFLCSLYEEYGDYDSSIDVYKKLIDMNPNDAIYHSNIANIYYLKGDVKSAVSYYQTAISLNPNKTWTSIIAQTLGYIFHESRENFDAAISAYQSASLMNPTDVDIYISLGSAFYDKGDYANALATYRMALEVDPNNARIHCNLGFLLWGKGVVDEAVKEYEKAIKLDPAYDIAYNNLGVIYLDDLGYIQEAVDNLSKAIESNTKYALAHYNLGRAMALKGDKIEAARLFQLAMDLNQHTNEMDQAEIKIRIQELFE
jgi:tetratricopeptide (TPR) repeat protein